MGLFSRKKAAEQNPYADQPFSDPRTPYQQARNNMAAGQPAVGGLPSNPRSGTPSMSTAPPSYRSPSMASNTSGGFANEQYGAQGGYGSDRYGSGSPAPNRGASGYGGFDDDAGKGNLFGNAGSRVPAPQQNSAPPAPSAPGRADSNGSGLFGDAANRYNPGQPQPQPQGDDEYGGYGAPRELTGMPLRLRILKSVLCSDTSQRRSRRTKSLQTFTMRPGMYDNSPRHQLSEVSLSVIKQSLRDLPHTPDLVSKANASTKRTPFHILSQYVRSLTHSYDIASGSWMKRPSIPRTRRTRPSKSYRRIEVNAFILTCLATGNSRN